MNNRELTPEEIDEYMRKQCFVHGYDEVLYSLCSPKGLLTLVSTILSKESRRSLCAINDWLEINKETYEKYKEDIR